MDRISQALTTVGNDGRRMGMPLGRIYRELVRLILLGLLVQFYFAGVGLFGAGPMKYHTAWGNILWLVTFIPLLVALAGRLGRRRIGLAALLLALMTLQIALPRLRDSVALLAAFHPVNALALIAISHGMLRWQPSATPEPSAAPHTPTGYKSEGEDT